MINYFSSDFKLGILGGGQLGKMLLAETQKFDIYTCVLDAAKDAPCAAICNEFYQGSLLDYDTVYKFGKKVDTLTVEIENVNVDALEKLEKEGVNVYPSSRTLRIIQNKATQKLFYTDHNIPTAPFSRFADTHGYSVDRYRDMSPWRDWVIESFNKNMRYDQFVTWQLAGDLLENSTKEMRLATAFNRIHPQNMEGGIISEEFLVEYAVDRTSTFGQAFMGLSLECARCQLEKFRSRKQGRASTAASPPLAALSSRTDSPFLPAARCAT